MRVLIVSQYFWPEEFRINDLAEGLVERGHEVTVLTGCPNYPGGHLFKGYGLFNKQESHNGVKIIRVPLIPRGSGSSVRLALNYLSFMISATILAPLLCRGPIDLIFVCQLSPVTVALPAIFLRYLKGVPVIMWVLDLWPESIVAAGGVRASWFHDGVDALVRFIYKHCDHILYSSKGFCSSIQSRGVEPFRLSYFPNWVEPIKDPPSDPPIQLPEGFKVLFAGNVGEAQDFKTILDAAERLRNNPLIQWIILGEGRQWNWVNEQIKERGLSECFHLFGRFPSDTMPAFFRHADALLVTLKQDPAFNLTVPGKVTTYMSCGKPIIAALDGEGANLIQEASAGLTVSAGNAFELANIVLEMSRLSIENRSQMGLSAKQYCSIHFDRKKLFTQIEESMKRLYGGR